MSSLTEAIQGLFEPAAHAVRRGDPDQMRSVVDELRQLWRAVAAEASAALLADPIAQGMSAAIEGVVGAALARSGADARRRLVESRRHALNILHALGRAARASGSESPNHGGLKVMELAEAVGVAAQNLPSLVEEMIGCRLIESRVVKPARYLSITREGVVLLEALRPGWQVKTVLLERSAIAEPSAEAGTNEFAVNEVTVTGERYKTVVVRKGGPVMEVNLVGVGFAPGAAKTVVFHPVPSAERPVVIRTSNDQRGARRMRRDSLRLTPSTPEQ